MTNTSTIYLAYGSNLNLEQMGYRCPYAVPLGPVELSGHRLLFRGSRRGAVATVEPIKSGESMSVPALLWEITPRCEEALDHYEGWPRFYRKEKVNVSLNDKPMEAMLYIMNPGHGFGSPSDSYLSTIRQGYSSAGFDTDFLDMAVAASEELALAEDQRWADEAHLIEKGDLKQFRWW